MQIVGIGECVIDKTISLDSFCAEGSKVKTKDFHKSVGGPVVAGLVLLAKLGMKSTLICTIGRDDEGRFVENELGALGIRVLPVYDKKTRVNTVLRSVSNGSRTILKDTHQTPLITGIKNELLSLADLIITDRFERNLLQEVMDRKKSDAHFIVDPSVEVSGFTLALLRASTFPILPYESLQVFGLQNSLNNTLHKAFRVLEKPFVVTCGEYGAVYYNGLDAKIFPSYDVRVVDVLGAGDVFRGAFAHGLLMKWPLDEVIDYANLVAALQCTNIGNGTAVPSKEAIEIAKKTLKKKIVDKNKVEELLVSSESRIVSL